MGAPARILAPTLAAVDPQRGPGAADVRTPGRRASAAAWGSFGMLLLAIAAILRLPLAGSPLVSDEGGYGFVAARWADGQRLYTDVFVDRPQGLLLVFRMLVGLEDGPPTLAARVAAMLAAASIALGAATAAWALAGRRAGVAAGLAAAFAGAAPHLQGHVLNGELAASAVSVWGVALAFVARRDDAPRLLLPAGLLAGAACTVKQSAVDAVAVVALVALLMPRERRPRALGWAALGVALPLGLSALHGLATGWGAYWYAVVAYRFGPAADPGGLGAKAEALDASGPRVLLDLGVLLALAAFGWAGARFRGRRDWPLLAWVGASTAAIVLGPYAWPHYFLQWVAPAAVGAGLALARWSRRRAWTLPVGLAAIAAPAVLTSAMWAGLPPAERDLAATGSPSVLDNEQIAPWLASNTAPGDEVYALAASADVYLKSGRATAYPYLWWANVRYVPSALPELRASLAGPDAPRWVVVYQAPLRVDPTGAVARLLEERYEPAAVVAGRSVLRLRT